MMRKQGNSSQFESCLAAWFQGVMNQTLTLWSPTYKTLIAATV
jgi:hypothetical protein